MSKTRVSKCNEACIKTVCKLIFCYLHLIIGKFVFSNDLFFQLA